MPSFFFRIFFYSSKKILISLKLIGNSRLDGLSFTSSHDVEPKRKKYNEKGVGWYDFGHKLYLLSVSRLFAQEMT